MNEYFDPEELSFNHWLSDSKEWLNKYGIEPLMQMILDRSNYEEDDDFGVIEE
jgi:hypothetical protein